MTSSSPTSKTTLSAHLERRDRDRRDHDRRDRRGRERRRSEAVAERQHERHVTGVPDRDHRRAHGAAEPRLARLADVRETRARGRAVGERHRAGRRRVGVRRVVTRRPGRVAAERGHPEPGDQVLGDGQRHALPVTVPGQQQGGLRAAQERARGEQAVWKERKKKKRTYILYAPCDVFFFAPRRRRRFRAYIGF